jgi:hypothetical protein
VVPLAPTVWAGHDGVVPADPSTDRAPSRLGKVSRLWRGAVSRLGGVTAVFFALVVIASGFSAIVLLGWPGSTGTTFSWRLRPDEAAALIGGLYLASAVAFGYALTRSWSEVKGLWIAVYGLSVPTLVETLIHDEVFDFGRWQAIAWLAIFTGAPIAVTLVLVAKRGERPPAPRQPMVGWTRLVLAALAVVFAIFGVLLLLAPTRTELSDGAPFALIGLTGAYLGAWCTFAAMLAAWSAWCDDWYQAHVPVVTLTLLPVGALVALVRTPIGGAEGAAYAVGLVAALVAAGACLLVNRQRSSVLGPGPEQRIPGARDLRP